MKKFKWTSSKLQISVHQKIPLRNEWTSYRSLENVRYTYIFQRTFKDNTSKMLLIVIKKERQATQLEMDRSLEQTVCKRFLIGQKFIIVC